MRQHTVFASPVCSIHQMFFLTFCVELQRHTEQVFAPPRAKGQIRRKELHCNQPLKIQLINVPQKPSSHQLQAAQPRAVLSPFLILTALFRNTLKCFCRIMNVFPFLQNGPNSAIYIKYCSPQNKCLAVISKVQRRENAVLTSHFLCSKNNIFI